MTVPRILVVDDSAVIRKALVKQLTALGAEVVQAKDGSEGLALASGQRFDLVVSDVDMPKVTGFELCERLKSDPATRGTPIIILSSRDKEEDIERGFKVGADSYLSKNVGKDEFREIVDQFLRQADFIRERLVLVVEPSEYIRGHIAQGLSDTGFQVQSVAGAEAAQEVLKEERLPDLVVCDTDIPGGLDLLQAMQRDPRLANIPFVAMSSRGDRGALRRLLQYGASSFLQKPFNNEQLVLTAEKLLSNQFRFLLAEKERLKTEHALMLSSITSLIQALEARDLYTRGHSEAVAEIAVGMGELMGFSPIELEKLEIAGRLHDLGKIGIPDNVLLKPGPLTEEEYEIIKTHPTIGAEILRPIPSMADLLPAVRYHHEKMDGTGYPEGLKGDKIPLWARMIAVGDVFHALTSNRPYRAPMPEEMVLQIIDEATGTHLCPDCVQTFYKLMGI
jgi:response regulator RpfG family c-di-GMP phosphodiesterase